jgi:AhpD family alkylhydroperoxidase
MSLAFFGGNNGGDFADNRQTDAQLATNDDRAECPSSQFAKRSPTCHEGICGNRSSGDRFKDFDAKTKELIALGIAVALRCDDCIAFHVKAAAEQGATKEEVSVTLGMAIYMGAGPSVMYATGSFHSIRSHRNRRFLRDNRMNDFQSFCSE